VFVGSDIKVSLKLVGSLRLHNFPGAASAVA